MTGQSTWAGESQDHQIFASDKFHLDHCCHSDSNIWESYKQDPPCKICPMTTFRLTFSNQIAFERWQQLDLTGRRVGFGLEFLNEASIDANLRRYEDNVPGVYERVVEIEKVMYKFRSDKQKQKELEEENQRKVHQRSSRSVPRVRSRPRRR